MTAPTDVSNLDPQVAADEAALANAVDVFQRVFYKRKVWRRRTFLGVACHQNPMDMWVIQELLFELRPDLVIETGTRHGGAALYYASILELIGHGRVVSVELKDGYLKQTSGWIDTEVLALGNEIFRRRVRTLLGSSVGAEVLDIMRSEAADAERVVVILDSDHRKSHVLEELHRYADLVSPGSYLIVQDTNLSGHPVPWLDEGPWEAVAEFLREDDRFEVDRRREELLFTWFPGGYLRRRSVGM